MNHSPTNPHLHKQLNQAIAIDSGLAEGFNNRGLALAALGRSDEALANYDRAITLNPDDAGGTDANHLLPVFYYPFSLMPSVSMVMRRFL